MDQTTEAPSRARVELPPQPISEEVLREKYAKDGDRSVDDVRRRVARALAAVEAEPERARWEASFLAAQRAGFIAGGRINSAAGAGIVATSMNCYVEGVGDCLVGTCEQTGFPGIYVALEHAAVTQGMGGGVGYDFSHIRPRGAKVKKKAALASGPVSYMRVFDRSCETVESAGARRGAQMGVLRCDHPDIERFIHAKDQGDLTNFNVSVAITDAFMGALAAQETWELVHVAEPGEELISAGARQRADGKWVYRSIPARELWEQIMRSTYDHAEPGVLFIDTINRENNLAWCERLEATNPCGEVPLPPFGCCNLGSIDLTRFIEDPFTLEASFDFSAFEQLVPVAVRMLDNVLATTRWPLPEQQSEAQAKRRVGLGFTGLGDALVMLGLRYDTAPAREAAAGFARRLRDAAYGASVDLAREKGSFPLLDRERYLAAPGFASRLPAALKARIAQDGIRNSHLIAIAPTGTISLAFADNASNGVEPAFSWSYTRRRRMGDGSSKEYAVEDHAYRLFRHLRALDESVSVLPFDASRSPLAGTQWVDADGARFAMLTQSFVTALEMPALDHMRMAAAVAPFVDAAISKTVNVPEDYPFEDFQDLYLEAWKAGLKGITTYRPNGVLGSVLSVTPTREPSGPEEVRVTDPDRRIRLGSAPQPALASLRWPGRPELPNGNPSWTYSVRHPLGSFAVFIGHVDDRGVHPFEVWVNGGEQPRGLGAIAKTLSMDMRAADHKWLDMKLSALEHVGGDDAFAMPMPPLGEKIQVPSLVAGFARLVRHRCRELGAFAADAQGPTPVMDALLGVKEPKAGPDGTLSWTVDVVNAATGDDLVLFLKELVMPDGQRRPYSMWLSGDYPRALDGLCRALSLDMRVYDPAWIGMKLRKLRKYGEANGSFLTRIPGSEKSQAYPSTIAYLAQLMIHRYAMLGILNEEGYPIANAGILAVPSNEAQSARSLQPLPGRKCPECANRTMIRKDGCDFCTACGHVGSCG